MYPMSKRLIETEGWFIHKGEALACYGYFGCSQSDSMTEAPSSQRVLEHIKARAAEGSQDHIEALMLLQLS